MKKFNKEKKNKIIIILWLIIITAISIANLLFKVGYNHSHGLPKYSNPPPPPERNIYTNEQAYEDYIFSKLKKGDIVAFKSKYTKEWYTGVIHYLFEPGCKYNKTKEWKIHIRLIVPIEPQFYEDEDKTEYYYDDIIDLKLIEKV